MIRLTVDKCSDSAWGQWLQRFDGNIFHSEEWAGTYHSKCSRPLFFHIKDNNKCAGIAVGIETWSPSRLIGRFSKRLEFETYPAVTEGRPDITLIMIDQILRYARKGGYRSLAFQSYIAQTAIQGLTQMGFDVAPRIEFSIDLRQPDDALFKNFSSHHRRKIKKAKKHNLDFVEAKTMDAMRQFRELQVKSRDRRLERGEDIGILDDAYYIALGEKFFARNLGRVFLMNYQDVPVSAAFVAIYAGKALYMYGGSSDEGFKKDAPALLFMHIFSRCREIGCKDFNLGGVPADGELPDSPSHGLYRFKAGFGGRQSTLSNFAAYHLNPFRDGLVRFAKRIRRK